MAKRADPRTARAAERWRGIIGEQRRSGLGVRAFCREQGVGEHSLYSWRRKLRGVVGTTAISARRGAKPPSSSARKEGGFLPVRVVSRLAPSGGIEIEFPSAHVLRAGAEVEPETLARAVSLLDARPC
jgi:transposase-like protein